MKDFTKNKVITRINILICTVLIMLLLVLLFVSTPLNENNRNKESIMVSLFIDFQDGFSDDTVVVEVNGQEIFNKKNVNTDYSLGLADSVDRKVPKGTVDIKVSVPSRNISDTFSLEVTNNVYMGVSFVDDRIDHHISDEMFQYF